MIIERDFKIKGYKYNSIEILAGYYKRRLDYLSKKPAQGIFIEVNPWHTEPNGNRDRLMDEGIIFVLVKSIPRSNRNEVAKHKDSLKNLDCKKIGDLFVAGEYFTLAEYIAKEYGRVFDYA